ncbi:MAG: lamin tail domain-containing protein [Phycisphaerae bacterium]|nr:lamin tail domain-containing protein [Phycisphaerae bacterium]
MYRSAEVLFFLLACCLGPGRSLNVAGGAVILNELMAANNHSSADPQGEFDDWVELHNTSDSSVNVAGLYLTDDLKTPTKWQIPTGAPNLTTIAGKGYLVVWLDNDTADSGLHASFKLDADEDLVALFYTDGTTLLDAVVFQDQRADVSYGRVAGDSDSWQYMALPTPGAGNIIAYGGAVAPARFSHERGFYDEPFAVTISTTTPDSEIYYTLDGSSPFDFTRSVSCGRLYTGPIPITTTTCLRAVACKQGWLPTNIDAHTYIFLDDVIRQATNPQTGAQVAPAGCPASWGSVAGDYQVDPDVVGQNGKDKFNGLYAATIKDDLKSAPTVSLVMPMDDWFGSKGIYINQAQDGTERACSLEWIDPNGGSGFQINCAIAMQGGAKHDGGGTSLQRWKVFKLSMRPRFKTATDDGKPTGGPATLKHRVFPDSPITTFDTFVLDAVLTNAWNHSGQHERGTYIQDQYVSDLHNAMGGYSPHGLYAHVYLNGLYWGMYYVHERPDDSWAAQMFGGEKEEYDVLKHSTSRVVNNGLGGSAASNFNIMINAAGKVAADPGNPATYDALCRMLDVDNFIADLLSHWYATNWDWPEKNWYATHRSPDGLWRFHTWDAEHSMELPEWSSANVLGLSVSSIHDKLRANPDYRMHFADLVHRFFFNAGVLTYPHTADMWRERMAQIDRAIVGESARWGDARSAVPHTRADWLANQNQILTRVVAGRSTVVLNWLRNAGLYPNVVAPVFYVNGVYQHGGLASTGAELSMQVEGTTWYTLDGSDPRLPGTTPASTETTLVAEDAAKRVLVPAAAVSNAWRGGSAFDHSTWISGTGGVGFERGTGYEDYFDIDVQSQMYNRNATCYVRIPFNVTVADLTNLTTLTLKIRYDDGFVVYLNGTEVSRKNFTGDPAWNSTANASNPDASAEVFESFDVTAHVSNLRLGENILAAQALNQSMASSDFLFSVQLMAGRSSASEIPSGIAATAMRYGGPMNLTKSACVKARALSGSTWSALNEAVYSVGPVAENLRVSEILYHPEGDPNAEFIELTNVGDETIHLNLVRFTRGIQYTFPSFELAAGSYCLLVRDIASFEARYGNQLAVVGQYEGNLDNAGEQIELLDAVGEVIQSFEYEDDWFDLTDGSGFSLTVRDPSSDSDLGSKSAWRSSASANGSPGSDDTGEIPEPGSVVINEILANPAGGGSDWIELHNTTAQRISITDWYLSDDTDDLTKYEIGAGTSIPAGGYIVFYQDQHFGNDADPGCSTSFGLSKNGETVYLHSGSGGVLTGYSEQEKFDASEPGVSFGRWQKSTGSYNFVALSEPTPGAANADPVVGPIVINEIMYHPSGSEEAEYVELLNISDSAVTLYDATEQAPWRFTDDPDDPAIELLFPSDSPVTLGPGEYLVLTKDLTAFKATYAVPAGMQVLAWTFGRLTDDSEKVQLSRPGEVEDDDAREWIRVDRVAYSDGSHPEDFADGVDPWPVEANGQGKSLSRIDPQTYGNDPANWQPAPPTPGRPNP